MENNFSPIFIGGTGRSGTTILKKLIVTNTRVLAVQDEIRVIVDPDGALDLITALSDRWSPYNADIAFQRFKVLMNECGRARFFHSILLEKAERKIFRLIGLAPRRYLGVGLRHHFGAKFYHQRLAQLYQELCEYTTKGHWIGSPAHQFPSKIYECGPFDRSTLERILERFFHDLYAHIAKPKHTHWLDDTPTNLLHVNELLKLFPEMRFIHIYRDPRDVTASYHGFSWGGDDYSSIAQRLSKMYKYWFELREKLPVSLYREISLERLAAHPKNELQKLMDFLNLELEKDQLQIPLNKVNAGRWMRDIPRNHWISIETILNPYIEKYHFNDK
jgi:hypothetical protein